MVAYALSVTESTEILESTTYKEAINSGEATEWAFAITEEIVSSQEPDMGVS